jgi:hypothetical protein
MVLRRTSRPRILPQQFGGDVIGGYRMDVVVTFHSVGCEFTDEYNEVILTQSACCSHSSGLGLFGD